MGRERRHAVCWLVAGLVAAAACAKGARSPEEAQRRLAEAAAARDATRLWDAVDLETRWSWMTVQRAHREAYDIVLSNFPEGPERTRHIQRFEAGALAESARDLFVRELPASVWDELAQVAATTVRTVDAHRADLVTGGGRALPLRKDQGGKWGWGWSGLADAAKQLERRATADLDLVRTSAADYERAAARQAR